MRTIRNTTMDDIPAIAEIYEYARGVMRENGNPTQWGDSRPDMNAVKKDIQEGNSYVVLDEDKITGVFSFINGPDETYFVIEDGSWLNDDPYAVIHKIAGRGNGILESAIQFISPKVPNIRIDTHRNNTIMQHLLSKYGFTYCGIIYTDDGTERLAYQKLFC